MGTVKNGTSAAAHHTQYRLLPSPSTPYRQQEELCSTTGGTTFLELDVKTMINSPKSTGMGFWSINPYVGCQFGCTYCYAHYAHRYAVERAYDIGNISGDEFSQLSQPNDEDAFSRHVFVKKRQAVLDALEHDLAKVHRQDNFPNIVIGTATDPYQLAERQFGITRVLLEKFLSVQECALSITTKSPLVCRDIDLLQKLGRRHRVTVYISLITIDARVIRLFEKRSPLPHARLHALSKLREAGINAGINVAPVLPGITDSAFQIEALTTAAKEAGAAFVRPDVLRMYPAIRDELLPIIEQHFPNVWPRYRRAYREEQTAPPDYLNAIRRRFERAARKHGIDPVDPLETKEQRAAEPAVQLSLL
ncbi:MAG: radical SAM protein [Myxococcota bacterium]|nr:radical SAM protein [Myxococcota bacterium]